MTGSVSAKSRFWGKILFISACRATVLSGGLIAPSNDDGLSTRSSSSAGKRAMTRKLDIEIGIRTGIGNAGSRPEISRSAVPATVAVVEVPAWTACSSGPSAHPQSARTKWKARSTSSTANPELPAHATDTHQKILNVMCASEKQLCHLIGSCVNSDECLGSTRREATMEPECTSPVQIGRADRRSGCVSDRDSYRSSASRLEIRRQHSQAVLRGLPHHGGRSAWDRVHRVANWPRQAAAHSGWETWEHHQSHTGSRLLEEEAIGRGSPRRVNSPETPLSEQ